MTTGTTNAAPASEALGIPKKCDVRFHKTSEPYIGDIPKECQVKRDEEPNTKYDVVSENDEEKNKLMNGGQKSADDDDDTEGLPIDRGWAWFVLAGCLVNVSLMVGYLKSLSILFMEYLSIFGASVATTTLIMGVISGTFSVSAIFTMHVLVERLGVRKTVLLGGTICSLAMVAGVFAPNIAFLISVHSVLLGIGHSMIHGPGLLLVGHYFKKRRGLAMSVAMSGISIGSGLFPVFTRFLLDEYGIRGTMLIYTGLTMNILVGASLYRPIEFYKRRKPKYDNNDINFVDAKVVQMEEVSDKSLKKADFSFVLTTPSGMNVVITDKPDPVEDVDSRVSCSLGTYKESLLSTLNHNHTGRKRTISECSRTSQKETISDSDKMLYASSPDIMSVSIVNLTTVGTPVGSTATMDAPEKGCKCLFLDLSLFKLPMFQLLVVCSHFGIPQNLSTYYLPALAMEKGVEKTEAVLLLLIMGILDFFSRLLIGFIVDLKVLKIHQVIGIGLICVATVDQFNPLFNSYPLLVMFAVVNGIVGSSYHCLVPVLIVDFMGLDYMAKTLGFVAMFHGLSSGLTHPILGSIRDLSGSYGYCFSYIGVTSYIAALTLLIGEPIARRRERARVKKESELGDAMKRLRKTHL